MLDTYFLRERAVRHGIKATRCTIYFMVEPLVSQIHFHHLPPRATVMASPLTPLDSLDAKKTITSATSSGVTTRPAG